MGKKKNKYSLQIRNLISDFWKRRKADLKLQMEDVNRKRLTVNLVLFLMLGYLANRLAWLYHHANADTAIGKIGIVLRHFPLAFQTPFPSLDWRDIKITLLVIAICIVRWMLMQINPKKYRQGREYGSAKWGSPKDIQPYVDPVPDQNIILTKTESLMMNSRPENPKYARNKNVVVIGGSGSGKTRYFIKPNLMQMHSSYVITDPKGTLIEETGSMLMKSGYDVKAFNTVCFEKSMKYNPFQYIRSEKDILKLVTALIANTKGEGEKNTEDFWIKSEKLLYNALIGYIWYEAPIEEQNFSTLLEFLNASETKEEDENYQNAVDLLFEDLAAEQPDHFAVRQYVKYKMAAGVIR